MLCLIVQEFGKLFSGYIKSDSSYFDKILINSMSRYITTVNNNNLVWGKDVGKGITSAYRNVLIGDSAGYKLNNPDNV